MAHNPPFRTLRFCPYPASLFRRLPSPLNALMARLAGVVFRLRCFLIPPATPQQKAARLDLVNGTDSAHRLFDIFRPEFDALPAIPLDEYVRQPDDADPIGILHELVKLRVPFTEAAADGFGQDGAAREAIVGLYVPGRSWAPVIRLPDDAPAQAWYLANYLPIVLRVIGKFVPDAEHAAPSAGRVPLFLYARFTAQHFQHFTEAALHGIPGGKNMKGFVPMCGGFKGKSQVGGVVWGSYNWETLQEALINGEILMIAKDGLLHSDKQP